jgi:hypothetical protein
VRERWSVREERLVAQREKDLGAADRVAHVAFEVASPWMYASASLRSVGVRKRRGARARFSAA